MVSDVTVVVVIVGLFFLVICCVVELVVILQKNDSQLLIFYQIAAACARDIFTYFCVLDPWNVRSHLSSCNVTLKMEVKKRVESRGTEKNTARKE